MITGFLTICPKCKQGTEIPTKKIKDSTPLSDFPWWERGSCSHCGAKIFVTLDIRVTSTRLDDPESYKLEESA